MTKVMIKKHARKNTCTAYNKNEKLFVRIGKEPGKTMKKRIKKERKKSYKDDTYLVGFRLPDSFSG